MIDIQFDMDAVVRLFREIEANEKRQRKIVHYFHS